jgi:predicted ATP-dependent protease
MPMPEDYFMTKNLNNLKYKYDEGKIIADFKAYIDKTYSQHYQTENNVQCFDAWIALDDATPTFRNTAMKYLWRYGKKNGNNKDDLLKVLHYTIMCLYNDHYKKGD